MYLRQSRLPFFSILRRGFTHTATAFIRVGEKIPNLDLLIEDSPGNKVNLCEVIGNKKALIIGVPAAFSPSCSNSHIPAYIKHPKLKNAGHVFVVSVNDPFVTKAWADQLDPTRTSSIRFLGDPTARFTEAIEMSFDGSAIFGGQRSKRYALKIEDGKVSEVYCEPDNTGLDGMNRKSTVPKFADSSK
ncbi:AhpC/TSA family protein [Blumeria hordei DH14]|uniref:AhpC/TSA family protein n=1 Tax=Blumeria graminis f. sp. hordei (strain DH14) TaxID=546991 RepID=N1J7C7_BLUG1|nr:AhpC/TSA family protein [Blumeria hordei DH14]